MESSPHDIHNLVRKREAARLNGDWELADAYREELRTIGVNLDDRRRTWRRSRNGGRYDDEEPIENGTVPRPPARKKPARDRRGAPKQKRSATVTPSIPVGKSAERTEGDRPLLAVTITFADAPQERPVQLALRVLEERGAAAERQASIENLVATLRTLPCARLYPQLTAAFEPILARWRVRFPDHVWQRFVKIPQGAAFGVARVLKEWNESCPVLQELLAHIEELRHNVCGSGSAVGPVTIIDLCSGFGFLSMFLAELADPRIVGEIALVDLHWPNASGGAKGKLSTDHVNTQQRT